MEGNNDMRRSLHELEWRMLQSKIIRDELMSKNKEDDTILFSSNQNMNFGKISKSNNGPLEVIPSKTLVSSSTTMEGPSNMMQSDIPIWGRGSFSSSFNKLHSHDLVRKEVELPYYGINLREWLESKCLNASKKDRLHLFKKIVQIVDIEHSKGIALMELRPSSFVISKTGDVKYIGSLIETAGLTRKRSLDSQFSAHAEKVQKVGVDKLVRSETSFISKSIKGKTTDQYTPDNADMKNSCSSISNAQNISIYEDTSTGNNWLTSDNVQLERKWYDFPMEFQIKDLLSQNIYSLGVLLFEVRNNIG